MRKQWHSKSACQQEQQQSRRRIHCQKSIEKAYRIPLTATDTQIYTFGNQNRYRKILKEIGYTGLFSVEFLHSKGVDYFLEVNLRNDGNGAVSNAGGVNLPNLLYKSLLGNDISSEKKVLDNPVYFMRDDVDFCHVLEHRLSLFAWVKDLRRTNTFLLYNNLDKAPFKKRRKSIIKKIVKYVIGKQ